MLLSTLNSKQNQPEPLVWIILWFRMIIRDLIACFTEFSSFKNKTNKHWKVNHTTYLVHGVYIVHTSAGCTEIHLLCYCRKEHFSCTRFIFRCFYPTTYISIYLYFPLHYIFTIIELHVHIDLDLWSNHSRQVTLDPASCSSSITDEEKTRNGFRSGRFSHDDVVDCSRRE